MYVASYIGNAVRKLINYLLKRVAIVVTRMFDFLTTIVGKVLSLIFKPISKIFNILFKPLHGFINNALKKITNAICICAEYPINATVYCLKTCGGVCETTFGLLDNVR